MKKTPILFVLLFSCQSVFPQKEIVIWADSDSVVANEIKKLEFHLVDLLAKGDISTYATYLTEDYIRISANGMVSTKEQVLESFRKSPNQATMSPRDLNVRVFGSTAILRAILDIEGKDGSKRSSIITKIFINRSGKWYMASLQGTPLQQ